jgi:hypothetical protein
MNPNPKQLWIDKLEKSHGKATGRLHRNGNFSAVGCLCVAYKTATSRGKLCYNGAFEDAKGNRKRAGCPADVLAWAGLPKCNPGIRLGESAIGKPATVVALNDGLLEFEEKPLSQIATAVKNFL